MIRTKPIKTALAGAGAALLATAALGLVAAPAIGDGGSKSKIVIKKLTPSGAKGVVTSSNNSCEGGKKVSLFRFDDYVSVKIEITKSNSHGVWKTNKKLKPGKYFAKVDATAGCRYDVSKYKTLH
jgi:hypothetical protein